MIVVSDTTPLSELAKAGQLNLLREVFGRVIIPEEVYREVTAGIHPGAVAVPKATWIEVRSVSDPQKVYEIQVARKLDLGECAAMILAEDLDADFLLMDDLSAREEALSRKLPIIGTIGILLLAKQRGLIPNVKEVLDALIAGGKRIGQKLYQQALISAGE